jgi:WD40 repeat protein
MLGRQKDGVFLSYARKDGEGFAEKLRARLGREASDVVIKQDRILLEGGVGWWKQITEAIDSVDFLILVMTPAAVASGNVQKEWRYARQQGVCVYPVKGASDAELGFSELPRWMSKAHFFELEKEWESFLAHLRRGCDTPRVPFMAPDLPPHFVARPKEFGELKTLLLRGGTTALRGAGGFGKTTLAAALCHDDDVIENFDDGILWVTLGQRPNVVNSAIELYAGLTDERPSFINEEDAAVKIAEKLGERTCLLVIDDVWDATHLKLFLRGGTQCARLFTTRYAGVAPPGAARVDVDEMSAAESIALLQAGLPDLNAGKVREISERLGNWPLALAAGRATLQQLLDARDTPAGALRYLETALARRKGPAAQRIDGALLASFELLSARNQGRLIELSIFPEDIAIPFAAARTLWGLDEFDTKEAAVEIATSSLLRIDLQSGTMGLHDVLRSWLGRRAENAAALHSRLIDAWPDWNKLPSDYAWRWLTWHLVQAGRKTDVERILWDPEWIQAKLNATDVNALIVDYEHLKPAREAELMQGALRLAAHVLAKDPRQFASQIVGRLLSHQTAPAIEQFITSLARVTRAPWLRPLKPTLYQSGAALQRTLEGHTDAVSDVVVTADGRNAVSASWDNTLRVWDLETGNILRTLVGHTNGVNGVAVTADGRRAVSASDDHTLKVWDLETGNALRALVGHTYGVYRVAVTEDGRRAVSASHDHTLKVWDLETGSALRTLQGHASSVYSVAVTADGRLAVSASDDHTLKVWDLETGTAMFTLEGHTDRVFGVAVTADGRQAVSASVDGTLTVWDLETGSALRRLEGHTNWVNGVAVTADGRRAVSASWDYTMKVWDLETGSALRTLEGHTDVVYAVAATADGQLAVSASGDKTLKVWGLETGNPLRAQEGHASSVFGVEVTADRRRAVSTSWDKSLKVWDLESGSVLLTLEGHTSRVNGVALTADGRRAVSASLDSTLRVWDLETGSALRTLEGHTSWVNDVAVTADGGRAVSASWDNTLKVWDLETGSALRTLEGHTGAVNGVAVTGDGRRAVSGSRDNTLKVWDLETGSALCTLAGHTRGVNGVAVTVDGRRAVSASSDKTLKVWDLETGSALCTLAGHTRGVNGVAVTADGRRAVSASSDKTLKVWDLETGSVVATFTCDAAALCCAFVTAQGIVAGDRAGRVHFLSLE